MVALSQLSRNLESRQDKTPMLSDLRESGSLEQDADVVMFIYRESEYNDEVPIDRADDALVDVAKHRNGPTGKANLIFLKQYARFGERAQHLDGARRLRGRHEGGKALAHQILGGIECRHGRGGWPPRMASAPPAAPAASSAKATRNPVTAAA